MDFDYGMLIGLIGAVGTATVLGLSYMGAYLLGHSRARREAELARQEEDRDERIGQRQHLLVIESAVASMAQAVERMTDAQRVSLLDRIRGAPDHRTPAIRPPRHDTPA